MRSSCNEGIMSIVITIVAAVKTVSRDRWEEHYAQQRKVGSVTLILLGGFSVTIEEVFCCRELKSMSRK